MSGFLVVIFKNWSTSKISIKFMELALTGIFCVESETGSFEDLVPVEVGFGLRGLVEYESEVVDKCS